MESGCAGLRLLPDGQLLLGQSRASSIGLYNPGANTVVPLALTGDAAVGAYTGYLTNNHWYVNPEVRPDRTDSYIAGLRSYELKDHLGNVRVVVTDDRPATAPATATAAYQYYAFGSPMPGRYGLANLVGQGGYRYGFNGKEKDDDLTKTTGATYDYGFRIYDARIAKFLSVDPLAKSYPMLTPYQFACNYPIVAIDIDGLESDVVLTDFFAWGNKLADKMNSTIDDVNFWVKGVFSTNGTTRTTRSTKPVLQKATAKDVKNKVTESSVSLVWGSKVTPEFREKVIEIAKQLDADPNHLMAIMAFESGLNPSIKNGAGSGATGLIQFMPKTARKLGTTTSKLSKMDAEEQLYFVKLYFDGNKGKLKTISDFYMAVLWPKAVGKDEDHVLFDKNDKDTKTAYRQNKGLDADDNGLITKHEASSKVYEKFEEGSKFKNK